MYNSFKVVAAVCLALFVSAGNVQAEEDSDMKYLVQFGWDLGGDVLARVQYVNGPAARVSANEGFFLDLGVAIPNFNMGDSFVETQLMGGWKYVTTTGSNGKVSFTSFPLTAIEQFVWSNGITLGGGVTYQLAPDLSGTGVAATVQVKMDNALGYIGQVGYTSKMATFGVRYTKIEYQPKLYTGKIKGDGYGFYAQIRF